MSSIRRFVLLAGALLAALPAHAAEYDVVVYGGTSAGVIAAVQAKKMGKSVVARRARHAISAGCRAAGSASPTPATRA